MQSWITLQLEKFKLSSWSQFSSGYAPNILLEYFSSENPELIDLTYPCNLSFLQNWINFFTGVRKFYLEELGQVITHGLPDIYQFLKTIKESPSIDVENENIRKVLLLLIGIAINCQNHEVFIKEIMDNFQPADQESLMNSIQHLNNDTEFAIKLANPTIIIQETQLKQFILTSSLGLDQTNLEEILAQQPGCHSLEEQHKTNETKEVSSSLTSLELELAEYRAKNRKLKVEINEQSDLVSELRQQLIEAQREISQYKQETIRLGDIDRKILIYKDEIDALKETLENYQKVEEQNAQLREKLTELDQYKKNCQELSNDLQLVLEHQEKNYLQIHSDTEVANKLRQKDREISQTIQRISELEHEKERDTKIIQSLREELNSLRDDLIRMKNQKLENHLHNNPNNYGEIMDHEPKACNNNIGEEIYQTMWRQLDVENKNLHKEITRLRSELENHISPNDSPVVDEKTLDNFEIAFDKDFNMNQVQNVKDSNAAYFIANVVQSYRDLLKKNCHLEVENQRYCQNLATLNSIKDSFNNSSLSLAKLENERDELKLKNLELSARIQVLMNSEDEGNSSDDCQSQMEDKNCVNEPNVEDSRELKTDPISSSSIRMSLMLRKKNLSKGQLKGEILRLSSEIRRLNILLEGSKSRQESLSKKLVHLEIANEKLTKNLKMMNEDNARVEEELRHNYGDEMEKTRERIVTLEKELDQAKSQNRELTNLKDELNKELMTCQLEMVKNRQDDEGKFILLKREYEQLKSYHDQVLHDLKTCEKTTEILKKELINQRDQQLNSGLIRSSLSVGGKNIEDFTKPLMIENLEQENHSSGPNSPPNSCSSSIVILQLKDRNLELEKENTNLTEELNKLKQTSLAVTDQKPGHLKESMQVMDCQISLKTMSCNLDNERQKNANLQVCLRDYQKQIKNLSEAHESLVIEKHALYVDFEGLRRLHNQLNLDYEKCNEQLTDARFNLRKSKLEISTLHNELARMRQVLQKSNISYHSSNWRQCCLDTDLEYHSIARHLESIPNPVDGHNFNQEVKRLKAKNNSLETYTANLEEENQRLFNHIDQIKTVNPNKFKPIEQSHDDELSLRERLVLLQKQKERLEDKLTEKSRKYQCTTNRSNTIISFVKKAKDTFKTSPKNPHTYQDSNSNNSINYIEGESSWFIDSIPVNFDEETKVESINLDFDDLVLRTVKNNNDDGGSDGESISKFRRPPLQWSKSTVTPSSIRKSESTDFKGFFSTSDEYSLNNYREISLERTRPRSKTNTPLTTNTLSRKPIENSIGYLNSLSLEGPPKVPRRTTSQRHVNHYHMNILNNSDSLPVTDRSEKSMEQVMLQKDLIRKKKVKRSGSTTIVQTTCHYFENTLKHFPEKDETADSGLDNTEVLIRNFGNTNEEILEVISSSNDSCNQNCTPKSLLTNLFSDHKPLPNISRTTSGQIDSNGCQPPMANTKKSIYLLEYGNL